MRCERPTEKQGSRTTDQQGIPKHKSEAERRDQRSSTNMHRGWGELSDGCGYKAATRFDSAHFELIEDLTAHRDSYPFS